MTARRGFAEGEYQARLDRAQAQMAAHHLGALLLTTEPEVRYFTGYLTRFWQSPTRPWFVIVPSSGKPVAVIPSIGAALMGATWIDDICTWASPDLSDDGIGLLTETLNELTENGARIGLPDGHETHVRMPLADVQRLRASLGERQLVGDQSIMRTLRMVKSPAEIAKIRTVCAMAGRAFARVPQIAAEGSPLEQVFREFQMLCLEEGVDWVPYLAGAAAEGGYSDVIAPADTSALARGDVLMLDIGCVWDGYFCDYETQHRNWSLGAPTRAVRDAHARLIEASDAAFACARPGQTASGLFDAMNRVLNSGDDKASAGRLGHGLGMSLTEWPSLMASDHTPLEAGMVLTLEPVISVDGKIMVHEENILITGEAAEYLSPRAGAELPTI